MQPGDLIKTTQGRIGVPRGTLGLIVATVKPNSNGRVDEFGIVYHVVQLCGLKKPRTVRRMPEDLEVIGCV